MTFDALCRSSLSRNVQHKPSVRELLGPVLSGVVKYDGKKTQTCLFNNCMDRKNGLLLFLHASDTTPSLDPLLFKAFTSPFCQEPVPPATKQFKRHSLRSGGNQCLSSAISERGTGLDQLPVEGKDYSCPCALKGTGRHLYTSHSMCPPCSA